MAAKKKVKKKKVKRKVPFFPDARHFTTEGIKSLEEALLEVEQEQDDLRQKLRELEGRANSIADAIESAKKVFDN